MDRLSTRATSRTDLGRLPTRPERSRAAGGARRRRRRLGRAARPAAGCVLLPSCDRRRWPSVPIRAIEQLGNMASRYAQQLHRRSPRRPGDSTARRVRRAAEVGARAALALGRDRRALGAARWPPQADGDDDERRGACADTSPPRSGATGRRSASASPYYEQNWIQLSQVAALVGIPLDAGDVWSPPPPSSPRAADAAEHAGGEASPIPARAAGRPGLLGPGRRGRRPADRSTPRRHRAGAAPGRHRPDWGPGDRRMPTGRRSSCAQRP